MLTQQTIDTIREALYDMDTLYSVHYDGAPDALEKARLARAALAELQADAGGVAVPDDVREALRMAIETRKSALYSEIPDLRQASIDKYRPYLDEMDMALAWLDQQARPQPPQEPTQP